MYRIRIVLVIFVPLLLLCFCSNSPNEQEAIRNKPVTMDQAFILNKISESEALEMFEYAINADDFLFYLVLNATDLNKGETREICTTNKSLIWAMHAENNIFYGDSDKAKVKAMVLNNRDLHFSFKDQAALNEIDFYTYSLNDLDTYASTLDINKIISDILAGSLRGISFYAGEWPQAMINSPKYPLERLEAPGLHKMVGSGVEERMFIHILIKNGVSCALFDDRGGSISLQMFKDIEKAENKQFSTIFKYLINSFF